MEALVQFFTDPANWLGPAGIPTRIVEHIEISFLAILTATVVALPLGFYIGHTGKLQLLGINLANIGRAIPSYSVMVMVLPVSLALAPTLGYAPQLGFSFLPIFVAMVLLAIPPILVATYAGLRDVDRQLVEASRGMGMRERQILTSVELPLASPVIVDGFRIATLQVIATATIGAFLSSGGLGRFIIDGIARNDNAMLLAGAILVAVLAVGTDVLLGWLSRRLTPYGVKVASGGIDDRSAGGRDALGHPDARTT